ncbi:class I lanthipeptide [Lacinutrix sp. Hel_I_90]|uniref:class I lanthipeptide n=1 Tax=Lacinutrix sp. Hel_I_90 TaxID=1249999 RepID=UPI000B29B7C9|nr:class I lanthipeptide [Lacinutrix sp. Hel_I_90]
MKTQNNNKLDLRKQSLVELNDTQLQDVNGGTSPIAITSSSVCLRVTIRVISVIITN